MRWFKHRADLQRTPASARVLERGGPAAYGVYQLILEAIAGNMGQGTADPSASYSKAGWHRITYTKDRAFARILDVLSESGALAVSEDGRELTITAPQLIEWRDEYARKSGHSPEPVRSVSGIDQRREDQKKIRGPGTIGKQLNGGVKPWPPQSPPQTEAERISKLRTFLQGTPDCPDAKAATMYQLELEQVAAIRRELQASSGPPAPEE